MQMARQILAWTVQAVAIAIALPALLLMFVAERIGDVADDLMDGF